MKVAMQRIRICALQKDREEIMQTLENSKCIHISVSENINYEDEAYHKVKDLSRDKMICENALHVLDEYAPAKKSMLDSFAGRRILSFNYYNKKKENIESYLTSAKKLIEFETEINTLKQNRVKDETKITELTPWKMYGSSLSVTETKKTAIFVGTVQNNRTEQELYNSITHYFEDNGDKAPDFELSVIYSDKLQTRLTLICRTEYKEKFENALRSISFAKTSVTSEDTPARDIKKLEDDIVRIDIKISDITNRIQDFRNQRENLMFASDYFQVEEDKHSAMTKIENMKHAFVLDGYIPKREVKKLDKKLMENFICYMEASDCDEKDAPVLLKNNFFASPVEGVIGGYSLPGAGEVDPCFLVSLFYYMMFGLMFSDAGYGIVMVIATSFVLIKFKKMMEESFRKTVWMFFFCGIATVFWGIMFNSYFGDAIDSVRMTFFGANSAIMKPILFNPTNEPMRMLCFVMVIGLIHLMTGLLVKFYQCVKAGKILDGIYDSIFWIVLVLSLVVVLLGTNLLVSVVGLEKPLEGPIVTICKYLAIASAVGIILTGGRENKNWGIRIASGLYSLYGISSYLGDVLSYSRLLALGLATGIIGTVVNQMGATAGNGILKVILYLVIFVAGHLLNFLINVLGAYVHTNRLQYVEFFGKFYSGGGTKFKPFLGNTKYFNIKE